jgi:hypothetical protein
VRANSKKETTTLRCIEAGHWDVELRLYLDHQLATGAKSVPVRVEVTGLNPQVIIQLAGNVALDHVGQTVNIVSFDLTTDGKITRREPPFEPIADASKG